MVEAKNLMKKDITVLGKGKSDPYAILTVGAQTFRTQTIDNTVDPKWDYWCEVSWMMMWGSSVPVKVGVLVRASDFIILCLLSFKW